MTSLALVIFRDRYLKFIHELVDDIFYAVAILFLDPDVCEVTIGRILEGFSLCEGMREKIFIVSIGEYLDESGLRCKCLEEDGDPLFDIIGNLCICSLFHVVLGSREIRFEEAEYDESEAFRDEGISEFCRDDDLGSIEVFHTSGFVSGAIRIESEDIRLREELRDRFFYLLDTDSDGF